ncbi:toxin-antitoxin system YwqK family antitoxin [Cryomorphaceae bacterium 1068]|nr:toxin-antitoxin system YwqK family antitoxin [Cryomorphaceae bacterium 1068]
MRTLQNSFLRVFSTFIVVFCLTSICRGGEEINAVDDNGNRQGYWKITGSMTLEDGFRENQIVEEGNYENNKKIGVWKKYYPSGTLRNEITFKNNLPRGLYKVYYPNGKLEEEGNWQGNKNVGAFKRYHKNGSIAQEFNFTSAGKRDGVQNYYYENGNLQLSVEVADGVANGLYKTFYPDGNPKLTQVIANGILNENSVKTFEPARTEYAKIEMPEVPENIKASAGNEKTRVPEFEQSGQNALYNQRKQVTQIGEFKNGRLWNGKWHRYDANGTLKKVEVYQEGKFVGYGLLEDANN